MVSSQGRRAIAPLVLDWYATRGRALRLRGIRDPYAVWIAETMSQQTQITRVEARLPPFLEAFPTVVSLASAPPGEVIRAWAGLGYNRRAVALSRAARAIVADHGGRMPADPRTLERLPGVGPYTARAVAAFAYGSAVTALDTNAVRVLGRVLYGAGTASDASRRVSRSAFQSVADSLAPPGRAGEWNHALMDLGALVCRPRPACEACPLSVRCRFRSRSAARERSRRPIGVARAAARRGDEDPDGAARRRLRGRLVAALRGAPAGEWSFLGDLGPLDPADAVAQALLALERDGLIERDPGGAVRLTSAR